MSLSSDLMSVQQRVAAISGESAPIAAPPTAADAFPRTGGALRSDVFDRMVRRESAAAGVNPSLVAAVAQTESGFNASATSSTGAQGIMQLMPATAQALGVADPYDPAANIRGGATYLRQLLDHFNGNVRLAVAAYNAGPGAVERYGGVPPYAETQGYVSRVLEAYRAQLAR